MGIDLMRYDKLVEGALRGVMIEALRQAARKGLPGGHHFYIAFRTDHPKVRIDADLKADNPDEMTIVLQHKYRGLRVAAAKFEVELSFNNVWRTLVIPFDAVTSFADPSVKFGLQFGRSDADTAALRARMPGEALKSRGDAAKATGIGAKPAAEVAGKVVVLDAFRKK